MSFYSILAAVENKLNWERREFVHLVVQTVSLSFSFFEHKSDITWWILMKRVNEILRRTVESDCYSCRWLVVVIYNSPSQDVTYTDNQNPCWSLQRVDRKFTKTHNKKDKLLMVHGYCTIDLLPIEGSHLIQSLNIMKLTMMWPSILMLTCSYSQIWILDLWKHKTKCQKLKQMQGKIWLK